MGVIRSSPLPHDQMDAALAMLARVTDQSLVKALEGLRGRIGNYREGTIGLVEWDIAEDDEPDRPDHSESRLGESIPAMVGFSSGLRGMTIIRAID